MKALIAALLVLTCAAGFGFAQTPCGCTDGSCGGSWWCRHCESYLGISCYTPPCPEPCCPCDPCSVGCHLNLPWYDRTTAALLEKLNDCHYRCRAQAAHSLGCKLHTDFCYHPEVVSALIHTLQCDPCYDVRRKAAYAIAYQGIYDHCGWMALYLASRLDTHYLVRENSADALKVLETHVGLGCIREWKVEAATFEKELKGKYKPGKPEWAGAYELCCAGSSCCGGGTPAGVIVVPSVPTKPAVEMAPLPKVKQ